jgi:hypothetical protein
MFDGWLAVIMLPFNALILSLYLLSAAVRQLKSFAECLVHVIFSVSSVVTSL